MMGTKWEDALPLDTMQYMRIKEHPMQIDESLIIIDNLEAGTLRLYEHIDGPLYIQQLIYGNCNYKNVVQVAEAIINSNWKDEGVYIHRIFCEAGYECLVQPMLYQIIRYTDFYNYQSIAMLDREYEHWFPYAKDALADFHKINRVYEYQLPGGGLDE